MPMGKMYLPYPKLNENSLPKSVTVPEDNTLEQNSLKVNHTNESFKSKISQNIKSI
jgi:hypothetical protein